jgi:DNA-binding CsgD family transcriptional regulator
MNRHDSLHACSEGLIFFMNETIRQAFKGALLVDVLNIRTLGFSATLAWSYLVFFSTTIHYSTRNDIAHLNSTYAFMLLGTTIVMILFGFLSKQFIGVIRRHRLTQAIAPVVLGLATVLLAFIEADWFRQPWCAIICTTSGLALGVMYLGWGEVFRHMGFLHSSIAIIASFILAALIYTVMLEIALVALLAAIAITALLPLVAGLSLSRAIYNKGQPHFLSPVPLDKIGFLRKALLSVSILTLVDAFMQSLFLEINPVEASESYRWVFLVATLAAFLVLSLSLAVNRQSDFGLTYRIVLFTMTFFFLTLPLLPAHSFLSEVLALSPFCMLSMLVWVLLARTANTYQLASPVVFGFGWGAATAGTLIGNFIGSVITSYIVVDSQVIGFSILASVLAVLFAYLFLFGEKSIVLLTREEDRGGQGRRPFRERCVEVSALYSLSSKETEILIFLAKGRSNPWIQEELNIAPGTMNTHIMHIYKKLGINNRQALIDLLDGRVLESKPVRKDV